jgi:hypothetical protein
MSIIYFSRSTKGFYSPLLSGVRTLTTVDPSWQPPMKKIPDPNWVTPEAATADVAIEGEVAEAQPVAVCPEIEVPDYDAVGPVVTIPNPDCKIPTDAVEITPEQHTAMLLGEQAGQMIAADADGYPVLVARPKQKPTAKMLTPLRAAVQEYLDTIALDWGFDSMGDAVSYVYSEDTDNQQRARALSGYRDACKGFTGPEYAAMLAETKEVPTPEQFLLSLPRPPVLE